MVKFPRTVAEHRQWFGMTATYFHFLVEIGVLPPGTERRGDAVWDFSEVFEAMEDFETVYFADVRNRGLIKIGYTTNLYNRMQGLAYELDSPMHVLGAISGNKIVEAAIHKRFECLGAGYECFHPELVLFYFIDAIGGLR